MKASKILMGFIKFQKKQYSVGTNTSTMITVSRCGSVNKSALDELIHRIGIALGSLQASMQSYTSLLEIVLGKCT